MYSYIGLTIMNNIQEFNLDYFSKKAIFFYDNSKIQI